ncbi:hypothetical protein D3C72_2016200 [compost metagenome]
MTGFEHQHVVARAERVDQRGFPGARARGRIDDDGLLGLEDLLDVGQDLAAQRAELRAPMVDGRIAHRTQDAVGHGARSRDLEEVAAGGVEVELDHRLSLLCELCVLHSKYFSRRRGQSPSAVFAKKLSVYPEFWCLGRRCSKLRETQR